VVSGIGTGITQIVSWSYVGDQVNAGTYTAIASYPGDANHYGSHDSTTMTIDKASSSVTVTPTTFAYDSTSHTHGAYLVSGVGAGVTQAVTWSYVGDQVNSGTYTAKATYAGDTNHYGSVSSATMTIKKATLTGFASTQSTLNIAKQGALVFTLSDIAGLQGTESLATALSTAYFTLKIGANTYSLVPSVKLDTSNNTIVITNSMKNGGDAGLLAADLQALNVADGTASTSASNAQVDAIDVCMSSQNYTFNGDALTRLFNSTK
jgi:hypothetical protein